MHKKRIALLIVSLQLLFFVLPFVTADTPPIPQQPHHFWGSAKNLDGKNITDNVTIKATIIDSSDGSTLSYTTKVFDGMYGWPLDNSSRRLLIECEAGREDAGDIIHFYINNTDTEQTVTFIKGGATRLDLTADVDLVDPGEDENENEDNNNGEGGNSGSIIDDENLPPVADANGPYRVATDTDITFDGSHSYDPDGTIENYTWEFGDKTLGYGKKSTHSYSLIGVYTVTLNVTDNDGLFNLSSTIVTVVIDSDGDGWSDEEEIQYGTNASDVTDYPKDNDGDYIPDDYDNDDDNDGLSDSEEQFLGSDPMNPADTMQVQSIFGVFIFVDTNNDTLPDKYYNRTRAIATDLVEIDVGKYLVDIDNDHVYDFIYDHINGTIESYSGDTDQVENHDEVSNNFIYVFLVLVIISVIALFVVLKLKKSGGKK